MDHAGHREGRDRCLRHVRRIHRLSCTTLAQGAGGVGREGRVQVCASQAIVTCLEEGEQTEVAAHYWSGDERNYAWTDGVAAGVICLVEIGEGEISACVVQEVS